jgi:hypothetical protein
MALWSLMWKILSFVMVATLKSRLTNLVAIAAYVSLALKSCHQYQKAQAIKAFA